MEKELNIRQLILKIWLEKNFVKGKFFSIEEVCEKCVYKGEQLYKLNKNLRIHDKCAMLSEDVRTINWCTTNGYKIIVKNEQGGIKLCESKDEFDDWYDREYQKVEQKYQYLNTLKAKTKWDGTMRIIDEKNHPVKNYEYVDIFFASIDTQE